MLLPFEEGVGKVRRVHGDEAAGPPLEKLRGGASLADLQQDYVLFTYAPLFLFGGLEHNPVQEWINLYDHKQIVFILQLDRPLIHIGGAKNWDSTIWAVEKQYWPSLALHIGSLALLDRTKRKLTRAICQELSVVDVATKSLHVTTPVTLMTFAVDSNLGCLAFAPGNNKPYLKFYPPREETIKLAAALLNEQVNPYAAVTEAK